MNLREKFSLIRDLAAVKLRAARSSQRTGTLIVRLDRIGDFALYAPFAHCGITPGEKTYFLVNSLWADLCAKLFPQTEVISLDPGRFLRESAYRSQMLEQITSLQIKRLLQPRFYRELLVEEMIAAAAAPEERFQFAVTPLHLHCRLLKLYTSSQASELEFLPHEHELQRNLRFAQKIDPAFAMKNPWRQLPFEVPGALAEKEYICVFPGSGKGPYCCWPAEKWCTLLRRFKSEQILICGTPAEKEAMEFIAAHSSPEKCRVVSDLSLPEFAAVTAHARCVVGNDTGGIHLAAMAGVPSLAISGRGQPGWFLPYPDNALPPGCVRPLVATTPCACENCFWRCNRLKEGICQCIDDISVDQVFGLMEDNNFSALR